MFPTPVGMNRPCSMSMAPLIYVPHTRGDEPQTQALVDIEQQCSPHPWG